MTPERKGMLTTAATIIGSAVEIFTNPASVTHKINHLFLFMGMAYSAYLIRELTHLERLKRERAQHAQEIV